MLKYAPVCVRCTYSPLRSTGPPGFRAYLLNLITRTGANGARTEPPCMLEFLAAKRKQIMRVGVTTDLMLSQEALHSFVTTTTGTDFGPMYVPCRPAAACAQSGVAVVLGPLRSTDACSPVPRGAAPRAPAWHGMARH